MSPTSHHPRYESLDERPYRPTTVLFRSSSLSFSLSVSSNFHQRGALFHTHVVRPLACRWSPWLFQGQLLLRPHHRNKRHWLRVCKGSYCGAGSGLIKVGKATGIERRLFKERLPVKVINLSTGNENTAFRESRISGNEPQ